MKKMSEKLRGVIVPMVTPFDENEDVDENGVRELSQWLIARGVTGLYPESGCGEVWKLSFEERLRIIEVVGEEARGKALFIPGTGGGSTRETIEVTLHAKDNGADACVVWPPYFAGAQYSDDAIVDHFKTVADATKLPIIAYDATEITGYPLSADLVERLADIDEIVGIKDSTGDLDKFADELHRVGEKIAMIQGWDTMLLACVAIGSPAGIMSSANVCPRFVVDMYDDFQRGDTEAAREKHDKLIALVCCPTWVADQFQAMKECLILQGVPAGRVRKPWFSTPFSDKQIRALAEALRNMGLLE